MKPAKITDITLKKMYMAISNYIYLHILFISPVYTRCFFPFLFSLSFFFCYHASVQRLIKTSIPFKDVLKSLTEGNMRLAVYY